MAAKHNAAPFGAANTKAEKIHQPSMKQQIMGSEF
jgi:hypothetical protein